MANSLADMGHGEHHPRPGCRHDPPDLTTAGTVVTRGGAARLTARAVTGRAVAGGAVAVGTEATAARLGVAVTVGVDPADPDVVVGAAVVTGAALAGACAAIVDGVTVTGAVARRMWRPGALRAANTASIPAPATEDTAIVRVILLRRRAPRSRARMGAIGRGCTHATLTTGGYSRSPVPSKGLVRREARTGRARHSGDVHVLVVEDDDAIAVPLMAGLEREGFEVTRAATGAAALEAGGAEVVLLDLGLPDIDGFEVCRRIRSRSDVPILVISARGEEIDRVVGLELGADDYLVKPFGFRELVARIRAVARRTAATPEGSGPQQFGDLEIDRRTRRVRMAGDEIALTPKEFDLLACLADEPGTVVTRQELLDEVWDSHWYGPTRTLDVHVASVRKKLGDSRWVETVRGVGFRLGAVG